MSGLVYCLLRSSFPSVPRPFLRTLSTKLGHCQRRPAGSLQATASAGTVALSGPGTRRTVAERDHGQGQGDEVVSQWLARPPAATQAEWQPAVRQLPARPVPERAPWGRPARWHSASVCDGAQCRIHQ